MDLNEIKTKLGYAQLNLNTAMDKENKPTVWMRHWDNTNRVAVSIGKDTVAKLQAGEKLNLDIQTEEKTADSGDKYTAHRIVAYTPAEVIL